MTPTELAAAAGISVPYASQILSTNPKQRRDPSRAMAFQIYDRTGLRFGPLVNLTAHDIETLRHLEAKAA